MNGSNDLINQTKVESGQQGDILDNAENFQLKINEVPSNLRNFISVEAWNTLTYEQKGILADLNNLPEKLSGVVPDSVWSTLNFEQKIQFLLSHSLLPEGVVDISGSIFDGSTFDGGMGEGQPEMWGADYPQEVIDETSDIDRIYGSDSGEGANPEGIGHFQDAVEQLGEIEQSHNERMEQLNALPELPKDAQDIARINAEKGTSFSIPTPKISGYKVDDNIINDLEENLSQPVTSGRRWSAEIINKIISAFSS